MTIYHADAVRIESDEHGFEMVVELDDGGHFRINVHGVAEELYDAVKGAIGPWLAEGEAARREYVTGRADDPTQQGVLDRILARREDPYLCDDPEGEWMREQADHARKAAKENA